MILGQVQNPESQAFNAQVWTPSQGVLEFLESRHIFEHFQGPCDCTPKEGNRQLSDLSGWKMVDLTSFFYSNGVSQMEDLLK